MTTTINTQSERTYQPVWRFNSTNLDGITSVKDALDKAELNWKVEKIPANVTIDGEIIRIPNQFGTVRMDTKAPVGIVGKDFNVIQNVEAFDFLDAMFDEQKIEFAQAGFVRGGRYVWMLAKFPEEYDIIGDSVNNYVFLINSHDGSKSMRVSLTNVRMACWNMLNFMLGKREENLIVRHSANYLERIQDAREALGIIHHKAVVNNRTLLEMAKTPIQSDKQLNQFIEKLFPVPVVDNSKKEKEISTRLKNIREQVKVNFEKMETPATNGTLYGLLNSVTEYVDHQRTTKGANEEEKTKNRFDSLLLGSGNHAKNKAFEILSAVRQAA